MKIALAQLNYTIGDIEGNCAKIVDAIRKAKSEQADLVLFAEQAVSGTPRAHRLALRHDHGHRRLARTDGRRHGLGRRRDGGGPHSEIHR